jgi:hypothetical protein
VTITLAALLRLLVLLAAIVFLSVAHDLIHAGWRRR